MKSREEVIAYARTLADLGADPSRPERLAAYVELLGPGESKQMQHDMASMSSCALTVRAVLRFAIEHPRLEHGYVSQMAMTDVLAIAREAGAAHGPDRVVVPGSIVIVDGPEHVFLVLNVCGDPYADHPNELLTCLDGGHLDLKGYESIIIRDHELCGGWDTAGGLRRRVSHVLDLDALLARFGR